MKASGRAYCGIFSDVVVLVWNLHHMIITSALYDEIIDPCIATHLPKICFHHLDTDALGFCDPNSSFEPTEIVEIPQFGDAICVPTRSKPVVASVG